MAKFFNKIGVCHQRNTVRTRKYLNFYYLNKQSIIKVLDDGKGESMNKQYNLEVTYKLNGELKTVTNNDDILTFADVGGDNGIILTATPQKPVEIISAKLIYNRQFSDKDRFFVNGFQSWTTSREYMRGDRQRGLNFPCNVIPIARVYAGSCGDYEFTKYRKNLFHSFSYTYIRKDSKVELFGTLNDRTGYTIFYADFKNNLFTIEKEVEGLTISAPYELFNIVSFTGEYDEVFDKYFAAYPLKSTGRVDHYAGYTSWYNYFQNITEDIIIRDLKGLSDNIGNDANIFQIDDGWETKVGDWLSVDPVKFPKGMKYIADSVHDKGYKVGLWLAPFSAQFAAEIVKNHPEWLIKRPNGKKLIGGFAWNGFYVIDIEKPEVKEYIKQVFDTVFNKWGYDMVKLDFLYSQALIPRNNKTRGQLMHEAMDFLRECCGDKVILGCGVPLEPTWGKVDACRISCDVELSFKDKFYTKVTNQEIISAKQALNNTIFRRHLNGRIFANDPDVFFLRDDGMKPAVYTWEQKLLQAKINHMFGDVLFVSDNVGNYDAKKIEVLKEAYKPFNGKVICAEYINKDVITIKYTEDGKTKTLTYNSLTGENSDK